MHNLVKSITCLVLSVILLVACETGNDNVELPQNSSKSAQAKSSSTFDVKIELVDRFGQPVGPNGLQGYFAINQDTGEVFYPNRSDDDNVFRFLPEGSYRFDAYDGYFDGASSSFVTLSEELVDPNGYIIVTLRYWSE